jgi:DNA-binding beta-propeller fold protein YncE
MIKKMLLSVSLICTINANAVTVEKTWESKNTLKVPESVIVDNLKNQLYVANINGKPLDKDGNGFISIISLDGEVKNLEFATGFNAPKGMAILDRKLFVSDIDTLRVVDLDSGKIIKSYEVENALFLNDVVVTTEGIVYVSDYSEGNKAIYKIANGKVEKWLDNIKLNEERPNGLWLEDDSLVIGTKQGTIFKANLLTKKISTYTTNIGVNGIDGLLPFDKNHYITSDWAGRVFISDDTISQKIIDGTNEKINAADIWYDQTSKKLYIPTFFDNRILCFKVK